MKRLSLSLAALFLLSGAFADEIWKASDGVHTINGTYTIPKGSRVTLEPGAKVRISDNSTLKVEGTISGAGTTAAPIEISGANNYNAVLDVTGLLSVSRANVSAKVVPDANSAVYFTNSKFSGNGAVVTDTSVYPVNSYMPFIRLIGCIFTGDTSTLSSAVYINRCNVYIRDCSFLNGAWCNISDAYIWANNIKSDRSSQVGLTFGTDDHLYLDNLNVTNAKMEGLKLTGDTRNGGSTWLGSGVNLQGNLYPVNLEVSGLFPGSKVPLTGNVNNEIKITGAARALWPNLGLPYFVEGSPIIVGSRTKALPGITVKLGTAAYIKTIDDGLLAYGTPSQKITFTAKNPANRWHALMNVGPTENPSRLRNVIVEGSDEGVTGVGSGVWFLESSIIRNNTTGASGNTFVRDTLFTHNGTGYANSGGTANGGTKMPNLFEFNDMGVVGSVDARNNWWNSSTGPKEPNRNPGGTGDPVGSTTPFFPFLKTRPVQSDAPPTIEMFQLNRSLPSGTRVTLSWNSSDDHAVASHIVQFFPYGIYGQMQTVATLPATARSYDWTVPYVPFISGYAGSVIRVVAVDNAGKEGFDQYPLWIPEGTMSGTMKWPFTAGKVFRAGEYRDVKPTFTGGDRYAVINWRLEQLGAEPRDLTKLEMPYLSSDCMRFVYIVSGFGRHTKLFYSPIFTIRPDGRIGDAAPTVTMTSPTSGQNFPSGSVVPIKWDASDDEGLRGFEIIASYDGGTTWQGIVKDLPGTARSYDWQLSSTIAYRNVRVLVIGRDKRFQSSSSGLQVPFSIGRAPVLPILSTLTAAKTSVSGPNGESTTITVNLNRVAPKGGAILEVCTDNSDLLTTPDYVTVPEGAMSTTFTVTTTGAMAPGTAVVWTYYNNSTKTLPITITTK